MGHAAVRDEPGNTRLSGRTLSALTAFWIGVSLLAGTAQFVALESGTNSATWLQSMVWPLVAGLVWVPLTVAIAGGSLRHPPLALKPKLDVHWRNLLVHGVASVSVSFILNAVTIAVIQPAHLLVPAEFISLTVRNALLFLHLNAGVYWTLALGTVAVTTLRRSELGAASKGSVVECAETITVKSGPNHILLRTAEIRWIEGAGDYVRLHLGLKNHLHSERLKRLEARLDPTQFVRVHRSAIVNVASVRKLRHIGHGDYEAVLDDGSTVRVSRTRRAQLSTVLEGWEVPDLD